MWGAEIEFVTYDSATDAHPAPQRLTEAELVTLLTQHDETPCAYPCKGCEHKDGLAWSPGFISAGKKRLDGNVEFFDVLAFDLDHLTPEQFQAMCAALDNLRVLVYSTHRHTPQDVRVRVVFFLTRRVMVHEFRALRAIVLREYGLLEDKKTGNPSRLFYLPTCPVGAERIGAFNDEGQPLDVDALLVSQAAFSMKKRTTSATAVAPVASGSIDMGTLRDTLKRYDPQDDYDGTKRALIQRVLKGEALADKGARDDAVHRAATIIGWLVPLDTPVDAALEVMRPSVASIPRYEGDEANEDIDGWMKKARYSFEKAAEKKLSEATARNAWLNAAREKIRKTRAVAAPARARALLPPPLPGGVEPQKGTEAEAEVAPAPEAEAEAVADPRAEDESWRLSVKCKTSKDGTMTPEKCGSNVAVILQQHPQWGGTFRFNEVTKDVECIGGPLSELEKRNLPTAIANWISTHADISVPTQVVAEQVLYVACQNPYDPLREYLLGVQWDGASRLDTWLEVYCGVATTSEDGRDITEYVRGVARKWIVSAVARALCPGCQADNVLVFEGAQGTGKSTTLRTLGGEFFADSQLNLADKDSKLLAASNWIVELSELSAMRAAENEVQKSFLSSQIDKFRKPYGARIESFPRRCVFAGTTNEGTYLRDDTGNRRFWPVACGAFDVARLRADRDLLWAEAVEAYKRGEKWWFEGDMAAEVENATLTRLKSDFADVVRQWWIHRDPQARPEFLTTTFVAMSILGLGADRLEGARISIGRALKVLGFERRKVRRGMATAWEYYPPQGLKNAPREERKGFLTIITTPKPSAPPAPAPAPKEA